MDNCEGTGSIGDVGVSAITCCELQYGVANSTRPAENQNAMTEFLAPLEVLDFPSAEFKRVPHLKVENWIE